MPSTDADWVSKMFASPGEAGARVACFREWARATSERSIENAVVSDPRESSQEGEMDAELIAEGFGLMREAAREAGSQIAGELDRDWHTLAAGWIAAAGESPESVRQFLEICQQAGAHPKKRWPLGLCDAADCLGAANEKLNEQSLREGFALARVWPGKRLPLSDGEPEAERALWDDWDLISGFPEHCALNDALETDLAHAEKLLAIGGPQAFTATSFAWILGNQSASVADIERWVGLGMPWAAAGGEEKSGCAASCGAGGEARGDEKAQTRAVELFGEMLANERWDALLWQLSRAPLDALECGILAQVEPMRFARRDLLVNESLAMGRAQHWTPASKPALGAVWSEKERDPARRPLVRAAETLLWRWPTGFRPSPSFDWEGSPATVERAFARLKELSGEFSQTQESETQLARRILSTMASMQTGRKKEAFSPPSSALRAWASISGADRVRRAIERVLSERPGSLAAQDQHWAEKAMLAFIQSGLWIDRPEFAAEQMSWAASGRVRQYSPETPEFSVPVFGMGVWELWEQALIAWIEQIGPDAAIATLAQPLAPAKREECEKTLRGEGGSLPICAAADEEALQNHHNRSPFEDIAQTREPEDKNREPSLEENALLSATQRRAARHALANGLRWLPLPLVGGLFAAGGPLLQITFAKAIAGPAAREAIERHASSPEQAALDWARWKKDAYSRATPSRSLAGVKRAEDRALAKAKFALEPFVDVLFQCAARDARALHPIDQLASWARCLEKPSPSQALPRLEAFLRAAFVARPFDDKPAAWALWAEEAILWREKCDPAGQAAADRLALELGLAQPPLPGVWISVIESREIADAARQGVSQAPWAAEADPGEKDANGGSDGQSGQVARGAAARRL